jgi:lipid II:glycine glycyltransferase (peptidoglycan interpeptide bridge formation enzyme)
VDVTSHLGDTAVGVFQASSEKGLKYRASYLVWWKALLAAKYAGMKRYDLGGVDPDRNPNVYQFKLRMGAEEAFHIGAFEICENPIVKKIWHAAEWAHNLIRKRS